MLVQGLIDVATQGALGDRMSPINRRSHLEGSGRVELSHMLPYVKIGVATQGVRGSGALPKKIDSIPILSYQVSLLQGIKTHRPSLHSIMSAVSAPRRRGRRGWPWLQGGGKGERVLR